MNCSWLGIGIAVLYGLWLVFVVKLYFSERDK
jgi:hypothetical protein